MAAAIAGNAFLDSKAVTVNTNPKQLKDEKFLNMPLKIAILEKSNANFFQIKISKRFQIKKKSEG